MTKTQKDTGDDGFRSSAGPSTDQNITGDPETGEFTTDKPPTTTTPANGSSNIGINTRHGNRDDDA